MEEGNAHLLGQVLEVGDSIVCTVHGRQVSRNHLHLDYVCIDDLFQYQRAP